MSEDFIGLFQANALGMGGAELDSNSAQLFQNLRGLVGELEADRQAIRGDSLQAFGSVKAELFERFQELVSFCQANGMDLCTAQAQVDATDQAGAEHFAALRNEFDGIGNIGFHTAVR